MPTFFKEINTIRNCSRIFKDELLKPYGLTAKHYYYMANIYRNPGLTQDELAKKLFVDKSNVTRQLSILEEKGLVERCTSPSDKRAICLYPTELLNSIFDEAHKRNRAYNSYLMSELTAEEAKFLKEALTKVSSKALYYLDNEDNEKEKIFDCNYRKDLEELL